MATVRDPQSKDTPALAVTDEIVGDNTTRITENCRRYHRQRQALFWTLSLWQVNKKFSIY